MKNIVFFILLILTTSFQKKENISDAEILKASFREFRDDVYQRNISKTKEYVQFPLSSDDNSIWHLVLDDKQNKKITEKMIPFTEKDFDQYYDKIFSKVFIKTLLKVKSKELIESGNFETAALLENKVTYKIFANYHKRTKDLVINFYSEEIFTDEYGEEHKDEFSVIYSFDVLPNNKIKLTKIQLAG